MCILEKIQFNHVQNKTKEHSTPYVKNLKLPEEEGVFIWKTKVGKNEVVFPSRMRKVYGGHEGISPAFDHWNGYNYVVPNIALSWALNNGIFKEPPFKENSCEKELMVLGKPLHSCPFCGNVPTIQFDWRANTPNESQSFNVKCCDWISSPRFNTIDEVLNTWNGLIEKNKK